MPTDDPTQILSEIKRLAKQFLTLKGYTPAQSVVEKELLPAVDRSQHVLGGGDLDQGRSPASNGAVQSNEAGSPGLRVTVEFGDARREALSNVKKTGQYKRKKAKNAP